MKAPAVGKIAERSLRYVADNPTCMEGTNDQADGPNHGTGKLRAGLAGLMLIA
jgi:hypothetical protein